MISLATPNLATNARLTIPPLSLPTLPMKTNQLSYGLSTSMALDGVLLIVRPGILPITVSTHIIVALTSFQDLRELDSIRVMTVEKLFIGI